jgi:hypothetical protein
MDSRRTVKYTDSAKPNIKPLKPKLTHKIFNNSVRTARKTMHFTIIGISSLMLFKEIIPIYTKNHKKHTNKNADFLIVKVGRTHLYHWALDFYRIKHKQVPHDYPTTSC